MRARRSGSYCAAIRKGTLSAPARQLRGRRNDMHWCGEMTRINRLRAPAPGETAHRYLLPLHCVRVAAGKRPARSKYAAVTSTGPQGPPQRGHARGRARGPVHADPDLPCCRPHLLDNAGEQLHPPGEGMQLKVQAGVGANPGKRAVGPTRGLVSGVNRRPGTSDRQRARHVSTNTTMECRATTTENTCIFMRRQCTSAVELVWTPRLAAGADAVVGSGVVAVPACGVRLGSRCDVLCSFTARCCRGTGSVHDAGRLQRGQPVWCALIRGVCPTATAACGGDCHRGRLRAPVVGATADPAADGDYRPWGHRLCGESPCGDAGPCTGRSAVLTWCTCRRPRRCEVGDRRECPRGCVSHGT